MTERIPWKAIADHQRMTKLKLDELKARIEIDRPTYLQKKLVGGVITEREREIK